MQLKSVQILTAMAFAVAVTAKPAPIPAKRDTLAGVAWELADRNGDAFQLIDQGTDCVTLTSPANDNWSSIEMSAGAFECFFWKGSSCGTVEEAMSLRDGDLWDIPSSPWDDFDNAISSYKCDGVSDQAGTAWEGSFTGDSIPLYTANGGCVNHDYVNEFTGLTSVTIDSTYTCTFYKDIDCTGDDVVVSSAAIASINFSNPPLPYYDGFDNVISSYMCSSL